jgi:hypothetical protein
VYSWQIAEMDRMSRKGFVLFCAVSLLAGSCLPDGRNEATSRSPATGASPSRTPIPSETEAVSFRRSSTPDSGLRPTIAPRAEYTPPGLFPPHTPAATYAPQRHWADVLLFTPYPFSAPLPPSDRTPIDGVYGKFDPSEPQWWNCRRCADYRPAGGRWRLQFDRGVLHLIYQVTGFASVASYVLEGNRLYVFNDPHCLYDVGEYSWDLEEGVLQLQEVQDACAIHLRAVTLTQQAWLSCQPPNVRAAVSEHWSVPPGCELVD